MTKQTDTIKLVAMDFDLTFYDHSSPKDVIALQPIFEELSQRGILLGLASGRSVREVREPLEEVGFKWNTPFPHFVICNEGEIRCPDESDWPGAGEWNENRNKLVFQANSELLPYFEELAEWAKQNNLVLLRNIQTNSSGTNIVFENPEIAERARRRLQESIAHLPDIEVSRNHHIVLAMPKQATKGTALAQLAEILDLKRKNVLAIGDNINDMSMLSKDSGFTVATVANADPLIRSNVEQAGGIIASRKTSLGVKDILLYHFY